MQISIPQAFVWRRLHSLMGLWLTLFLTEHLLVNSQAALWVGESGREFIELVNRIHNLPYLQVVEVLLLGIPLLVHAVWGIRYARASKMNSFKSDGSTPSLKYGRNKAYSWQRITSWFLLFAILFHVVQFRFLAYPTKVQTVDSSSYLVTLDMDKGLYTLSGRLNVTLYDQRRLETEKAAFAKRSAEKALRSAAEQLQEGGVLPQNEPYDHQTMILFQSAQNFEKKASFLEALEKRALQKDQVIASCPDFGTASLLMVRDHFKNPFYLVFYTLFVLSAVFHAFNGFWTFLITWGLILKMSAQKAMVRFCIAIMLAIGFLGLAAVWGTYWINLKS